MRTHAAAVAAVSLALSCAGPAPEDAVLPVVLPSTPGEPAPRQEAPLLHRPAEVTGGTILALGEHTLVVSDGDTDRVVFVTSPGGQNPYVSDAVGLPERSRAGRLALGDGVLFVALRGTGELVRIDAATHELLGLTFVCAEPRGVTWDGLIHAARVACANGVLATVDLEGRLATERWPADLRDVLVQPDGSLVGVTFRTGETVTREGTLVRRLPDAAFFTAQNALVTMVPTVAWRTVGLPNGAVMTAHQRAVSGPVSALFSQATTTSAPWGGTTTTPGCVTPVVRSAITLVKAGGELVSTELPGALPVDVAVSDDHTFFAVALAGSRAVVRQPMPNLLGVTGAQCPTRDTAIGVGGIASGVAFLPSGELGVHTVQPSRVVVVAKNGTTTSVALAPPLAGGMELFHVAVNGVACASCHPEARDDGHVWENAQARRRTPPLVGGILSTAPFHWQGEHANMSALMADTFVARMGGTMPLIADVRSMEQWLHYLPAAAPLLRGATKEQLARGKVVFESPEANCTACHGGELLTDNLSRDVGTGGKFQTPSLRGVGSRGPWLHDGRARTLAERFQPSGGGDKHGGVSQLSADDVGALVAYLETL